MRKILILTEEQYNAVFNIVSEAVSYVNETFGDELEDIEGDEKDIVFSGFESAEQHRALESIDWEEQKIDWSNESKHVVDLTCRSFTSLEEPCSTIEEAREALRKASDAHIKAEMILERKISNEIREWVLNHKDVADINGTYFNDGVTITCNGEDVLDWDIDRMSKVLDTLKSYKPQWTTILDFPNNQETENEHNNRKPLFDSFEEAMVSAQEMAEQYAIDVMHANVTDGVTCHIHVHQYATPESDPANVVEVYNDEDPDWPHYDYRVEVKKV